MRPTWRITTVLATAALMSAAPAAAEWYAFGNFEPSTPYDSETWMFPDAPGIGDEKVYFFAMSTMSYASIGGDPNSFQNIALLKTQIEPAGAEYHDAHLGVWKDCNGDGYVGMAETALREYSAQLLGATAVCPPVTGPSNEWPAGAHNYNGWVSEFIPIVDNLFPTDRRAYRDPEAAVWGDFHRPDEKPFHRSCALNPFPRGTLQTVGGFLNYFDCRVDLLGPWNDVMAPIGDPLGLSFADEDDARSGALGQMWLFGPDSTDHAAVKTVDCDQAPIRAGDVYNSTPAGPLVPRTLHDRYVPHAQPGLGPAASDPTQFTIPGQLNQTTEEWRQDCDTSNDEGQDFYSGFEADFNGVNPNNKTEADWNFGVLVMGRGIHGLLTPNSQAGISSDLGVGMGGTHWVSDSRWLSKTGPRALRVDLDNGGVQIAPAYWLSFYARIGDATTQRGFEVPGGDGTYGSWHCGSDFETPGIRNGWNCDPAVWYINPDGSFPPPNDLEDLAKPGWSYDLRDVDCYDGRIGSTGVSIQPAYYGGEPCIPFS